jgi:hypothetical protein
MFPDRLSRSRPAAPERLEAWGYSNLDVLPGEDPQEFERLHQSLIDEYMPSGPSECDMVMSLARYMWRKSRLTIYAHAAAVRKDWGDAFAGASEIATDAALDERLHSTLTRLKTQIPVQIELAKSEKELLPQILEVNKNLSAILNVDKKEEIQMRRRADAELELARLGDQITVEKLIEEIDLDERLDKNRTPDKAASSAQGRKADPRTWGTFAKGSVRSPKVFISSVIAVPAPRAGGRVQGKAMHSRPLPFCAVPLRPPDRDSPSSLSQNPTQLAFQRLCA